MRKHDPFLKRLYKAGARDAEALFFPELAARVDWSQLQWVDKEVAIEGEGTDTRAVVADLVGLTRDIEGRYLEVLIHPEIQMQREPDMDWRVLQYNAGMVLQREGADARVITFVFYHCGGTGGIQERRYALDFYDTSLLEVRYWSVGLGDLKAEDYAESDNPMAWALAAWMRKPRRGRGRLRFRLLQKIVEFVRDPRYRRLLLGTVETYLTLNPAEKAEEDRLLAASRHKEVGEMVQAERDILTDLDKLVELDIIAEKMELGEKKARLLAMQDALLLQMEEKFGSVPDAVAARVRGLQDTETLSRLLRALIHADSQEAMGL